MVIICYNLTCAIKSIPEQSDAQYRTGGRLGEYVKCNRERKRDFG